MGDGQTTRTEANPRLRPDAAVEQELLIRPDGRIDIVWVTPQATRLVMGIHHDVAGDPFPVGVISGDLYCG